MKGVVGYKGDTPEFGVFEGSHDVVTVMLPDNEVYSAKNLECIKDRVIYSKLMGMFIWKSMLTKNKLLEHTKIKGINLYNYSFPRVYEAIGHLELFTGEEKMINPVRIMGANDIKYTLGLEYETSCGMIPEHICFRDGLIPLRDGSITGVEYSSIVLKKENGINLIRQELETLKEYTEFNKECALHMHFGGYPVRGSYVFTLYSILYILQNDFKQYCNEWIYNTANYKASRKDYCKMMPAYSSFREMYESMVGLKWVNSLRKPHPSDTDREHKWNIHTRYYCVNFINMLCYESPKTVEFRFLRPTFNFTKVYTWILVFNAILKIAEDMTNKYGSLSADAAFRALGKEFRELGSGVTIDNIVRFIYSGNLLDAVLDCLYKIRVASRQQKATGDLAGSVTKYEDDLLDPNIYLL